MNTILGLFSKKSFTILLIPTFHVCYSNNADKSINLIFNIFIKIVFPQYKISPISFLIIRLVSVSPL